MAICAYQSGIRFLFLPEANAREASVVKELHVIPVKDLRETAAIINGDAEVKYFEAAENEARPVCSDAVDFADVKGQENVKRALEVAASGGTTVSCSERPAAGKPCLQEAADNTAVDDFRGSAGSDENTASQEYFHPGFPCKHKTFQMPPPQHFKTRSRRRSAIPRPGNQPCPLRRFVS